MNSIRTVDLDKLSDLVNNKFNKTKFYLIQKKNDDKPIALCYTTKSLRNSFNRHVKRDNDNRWFVDAKYRELRALGWDNVYPVLLENYKCVVRDDATKRLFYWKEMFHRIGIVLTLLRTT